MTEDGQIEKCQNIFIKLLFCMILLSCLLFFCVPKADASIEFRVLVIHSYNQEFKWTKQIMTGIKSVFDNSDINVDLKTEYMDTKFHKPEKLFPVLQKLYAVKYHKTQPDLIISSDNNALNFLLKNRKKLFPHIPVVFCGINNYSCSLIKNQKKITGVAEDFDFKDTIDLALRLQPNTRYIAIISDATHTSKANLNRMKQQFSEFTNRVSFIELTDMTAAEYKKALQKLPDNSIIIHNGLYLDCNGKKFTLKEGLAFVVKNSHVPVYTLWQFMIDQGVLGGVVVNGFSQGEHAALMAEKILKGESPDNIPVITASANVPMFDYTAMKRFGIDESDLPVKSIILNMPHSFYSDHKDKVWIAIAGMMILVLIIMILSFNIHIRKKVEAELKKHRDQLEDLVKDRTIELERKNKLFQMAQKLGNLGPWRFDVLENEFELAEETYKICEITFGTLLTYDLFMDRVHPDDRKYVNTEWQSALKGKTYDIEYRLVLNGKIKWIREKAEFEFNSHGICVGGKGFIQDISNIKRSALLLQESEKKYQALSDASFEAILIGEKGYCIDANLTASKMFGYSREELIGMFGTTLIAPGFRELVRHNMLSNYNKPYEAVCQKKDGTLFYTEIHGFKAKYLNRTVRITVIHDIDERKKAEKYIKASLKEKEALLKEIHHRVKNNMQVISSLLKLQALSIKDAKLTELLMDCRQRVHAMAFAHEILHSSDRLTAVNFKDYILKLTDQLYRFYNIRDRVKLTVHSEDISLDIDHATTLGLIINELISNSMKYAFPENRPGEIFIELNKRKHDISELIVRDNGIGISEDINWRNSDSLGLQLIILLVENQLDGNVELDRDAGTRFTIRFRLKETEQRSL